jgi:hypothetical protein
MREFGIVHDRFPGSGDLYKNRAEGSIAGLTDEQREKLFGVLNPKPENVAPDIVSTVKNDSEAEEWTASIDGEVISVWDQIPENQRKDIEMGIQYVLENWRSADLVLGRWAKKHIWWWEEAVWPDSSLDKYNLIFKPNDKRISGSNNILLILRVSPTSKNAADIAPELLELPSFDGWYHAMLMPGMVFHKPLDANEFIEQLTTHKQDLSIAA